MNSYKNKAIVFHSLLLLPVSDCIVPYILELKWKFQPNGMEIGWIFLHCLLHPCFLPGDLLLGMVVKRNKLLR